MLHNMGGVASPAPGEIGASILRAAGHQRDRNQPCSQCFSCLLFLVLIGVGVETLQRGQFKSLAFYLL